MVMCQFEDVRNIRLSNKSLCKHSSLGKCPPLLAVSILGEQSLRYDLYGLSILCPETGLET